MIRICIWTHEQMGRQKLEDCKEKFLGQMHEYEYINVDIKCEDLCIRY